MDERHNLTADIPCLPGNYFHFKPLLADSIGLKDSQMAESVEKCHVMKNMLKGHSPVFGYFIRREHEKTWCFPMECRSMFY